MRRPNPFNQGCRHDYRYSQDEDTGEIIAKCRHCKDTFQKQPPRVAAKPVTVPIRKS